MLDGNWVIFEIKVHNTHFHQDNPAGSSVSLEEMSAEKFLHGWGFRGKAKGQEELVKKRSQDRYHFSGLIHLHYTKFKVRLTQIDIRYFIYIHSVYLQIYILLSM